MAKLRIGLIGFGAWVRSAYLPALQFDGRAVVTAVTASTEKTRRFARGVLGADVAVYDGYQELLEAELDAVMIALPDRIHQSALTAALDAGKAVFYEPPVSHLRREIPPVLARLLAARQVTFAHLELGFHPAVLRARELIAGGAVGALHSVMVTLRAGWGAPRDADLCLTGRMSCWYVDVLNKLIGGLPSRVLTLDGSGNTGRMQTASMSVYDYGGAWGLFKADVGLSPDEASIAIEAVGSKGSLAVDYFTGELTLRSAGKAQPVREEHPGLTPYADYPGVRECVSTFLDAVAAGDRAGGNAGAVARLNAIGLAAEASRDSKTWEPVPERPWEAGA